MIDIAKVQYRVVAITPQSEQIDITDIVTKLGWEEGEKELSSRISMNIHNSKYKEKYMHELIIPLTPIFIYALIDGRSEEVIRGTVMSWGVTESNGTQSIDIVAYDEAIALRHNKANKYFSDGATTKAVISEIFSEWGVPYKYEGPSVTHSKFAFKNQYLSDMVLKVLDDAKKKGAGAYVLRANKGSIEVVPRGSNTDVYHFDMDDNLIKSSDRFDCSGVVTRVVIVGKSDKEGHQKIESVIDSKISTYGVRQEIYQREEAKSLDDATKAAKQMLKEKGGMKRVTSIQAPDIPFIRKGDRIRVRANTVQGYFFVKSIQHNAENKTMTLSIDEDKKKNREVAEANGETYVELDTVTSDEYTGGE